MSGPRATGTTPRGYGKHRSRPRVPRNSATGPQARPFGARLPQAPSAADTAGSGERSTSPSLPLEEWPGIEERAVKALVAIFLRLVALGLGPEVTTGGLALLAQLLGPPRLHLCLSVSDLLKRHASMVASFSQEIARSLRFCRRLPGAGKTSSAGSSQTHAGRCGVLVNGVTCFTIAPLSLSVVHT